MSIHDFAVWIGLPAALMLGAAGCEQTARPASFEEQIAQRVAPVEELATRTRAESQAGLEAHEARINELKSRLAEQDQRNAELARRLESAEAAVARMEALELAEAVAVLETVQADLGNLSADLQSRVTDINKSLDAAARDRRRLAGADAEMRGYVDSSVQKLDGNTTQARDALRTQLVERLDTEHDLTRLNVRRLENEVEAGAAQIALAIQLMRESLQMEQRSMAGRQQRVNEVLAGLDQPFTARGIKNPDDIADLYFKDAIALHERYVNNPESEVPLEDALLNYRKGLALRPDDTEMHYQLCDLLVTVDRASEAEPHLRYYLRNGTNVEHLDKVRSWLGED